MTIPITRLRARSRGGSALFASILLVLSAALPLPLLAQVQGPRVGTVEVGLLLRQLDGEKRVLMIGAHPDDEDTAMLAALARGYGARAAYLSLTRGDGGQNLIGSELGEGLGLLRTGELLAARSIDGAEQFFTRAFDFGYSKTADETFSYWPEDELVRDVTWVIRTFRPQVILSVFTGTPRDGHGQHQAAGIVARRAFEVSGDPDVFPDQLELGVEPWQVSKIYQLNRFGGGASDVEVQTGQLDPLLGYSFYQIAMQSRSQHRSQDMGSAQSPGPRASGGTLLTSRVDSSGEEDGFFAGIDTTLAGIAHAAAAPSENELQSAIADYRESVTVASELLQPDRPTRSVPALQDAVASAQEALEMARRAPEGPARTELVDVLERRERLATRALLAAAGIEVDVRIDRDRIVPGEDAEAAVSVWNAGSQPVSVQAIALAVPDGWDVPGSLEPDVLLGPGEIQEWRLNIRVPASAELSREYYLRQPRDGALYRWPADGSLMGRPKNPPLFTASVALTVGGGTPVTALQRGSYVTVDQANGELRLPVFVVPKMSVSVEPGSSAWPMGAAAARPVAVEVANLSQERAEGDVKLVAPSGWEVTPDGYSLTLPGKGGEASFRFDVRPGAGASAGKAVFRAVVASGGREYEEGVTFIDYRHVDPAPLFRPAAFTASYFPVAVAEGLRVGYIMGPGDSGFEALADLGVQAELLGPEDVRSGDLDRFDTIVLGIRAYETRPDLQAANERLLDYARRGGTVIVQYNQYQYPEGGYAPLPVEMARPHDRITDPNAEVTFLQPDNPILSTPNRIDERDFEGWVQERGLYFLSRWDDGYTPLLEMSDPGEGPKRGALLVARLGEGAYVYTGLALFRQFPAGVPGAFRLLANLVSLRGSDLTSQTVF